MERTNMSDLKERLENIDKILDGYEKCSGIPSIQSPGPESELNEYLNMPCDYMSKLLPDQCMEISMRLAQFAFYLQRLTNKESTRIIWAESVLESEIANEIGNYTKEFLKHETKIAIIAKSNTVVKKIKDIITYAKQRLERLNMLAYHTKHMSEIMINMYRAKGKVNG